MIQRLTPQCKSHLLRVSYGTQALGIVVSERAHDRQPLEHAHILPVEYPRQFQPDADASRSLQDGKRLAPDAGI
jgi:hypothetical protein